MLLAVVAALASACGFAVSTSLQHHAAGASVASAHGVVRLLVHLLTTPLWLLGALVGAMAFSLHAVALNIGAIALVQPIMVSGVVFAIFVRAAMDREVPSRDELRSVSVTAVGLAVFLAVADPTLGDAPDARTAALLAGLGLLISGSTGFVAIRRKDAGRQALLLGVAAGVLFGLTAGLLKFVTVDLSEGGPLGVILSWRVWALLCAGVLGVAMNQRAFQIAPLSVSMPVLNIVNVLVALLFGFVVFAETPAHSPLVLAVQAAALVCMAVGIRQFARAHDRAEAQHDHTSSGLSARSR